MKKLFGFTHLIGLLVLFSSFSVHPDKADSGYSHIISMKWVSLDEVTITFNNEDVCGLLFLGEVYVTENWFLYRNNDLKDKTIAELKMKASEKGGQIVYVDNKEKTGFGIHFKTVITGYVYKK